VSWFLGAVLVFLGVAVIILLVRVALLSAALNEIWRQADLRYWRAEEDFRTAIVTLRLDIGLPASSMFCGLCLQRTGGDPRRHMDYCRFSYTSWVRDFKRNHPGEPLPEGADDPDEQQQQGHRPVPENPA